MTNYIIGGGISGLVASFYTGFPIITKPNENRALPCGPRYLYATKATEKLLEDLNLQRAITGMRPGYYYQGKVHPPSPKLAEIYHRIIRRSAPSKEWLALHTIREFEIFTNTLAVVAKRLKDVVSPIIYDTIIGVDVDERIMVGENGVKYPYDNLISTIPWPVFAALSSMNQDDCRFSSIVVDLVSTRKFPVDIYSTRYDYMYLVGAVAGPYRITRYEYPFVLAESIESMNNRGIHYEFGKILSGKPALDLSEQGIHFFGRFAEWKKSLMTHDVVASIQKSALNTRGRGL